MRKVSECPGFQLAWNKSINQSSLSSLVSPTAFTQVDFAVIASQAGATLNNLLSHAQELVAKLRSLQLDQREFVCLKFLVLFSLGECQWMKRLGRSIVGTEVRLVRIHRRFNEDTPTKEHFFFNY